MKQVIGTVNKVEAKGETPLGEGLNLAFQVLTKQRYKLPGMKNLIIMISDCFPEPLEGGHKDLLEEPSYKAVITTAEKMKQVNIDLIVINPSEKKHEEGWNVKLINKVIDVSNAKYIRIQPKIRYNLIKGEKAFIRKEDSLHLMETIWKVKTGIE